MPVWDDRARERLAQAVRRSGTQEEVSARSGVPRTTLQKVIGGGAEPKIGTLLAIANEVGVSVDQLVSDEGHSRQASGVRVAALNVRASAGDGIIVGQENVRPGPFEFEEEFLRRRYGQIDGLRLLQVSGDSQEPMLSEGDWVMIDENRQQLKSGLFVLSKDDVLMLKRVQVVGDGLHLLSRNTLYPPIPVTRTEMGESGRFRLIGEVVSSFRFDGVPR